MMVRLIAIVLVVAGSCLFCAGAIGLGWTAWASVSGALLPATMPDPAWLAGGLAAGVLLAIGGSRLLKAA